MQVFISWSGETSRQIARALHDWLPRVIQSVKPWMSEKDIERGAFWFGDMSKRLDEGGWGILCLTPQNLESGWIHFEAGILTKTMDKAQVCPYLFGVAKSSVSAPLSLYQMADATKDDTHELVRSINAASEMALSPDILDSQFELLWPRLQEQLQGIGSAGAGTAAPLRDNRELLEELLELVRGMDRRIRQPPAPSFRIPANPQFFETLLSSSERSSNFLEQFAEVLRRNPNLKLPEPPAPNADTVGSD